MKWTSEQLEAIDKDNTSIIVSAGAGSGKTAVLTERVIRKIKDGVNINELLILTFTNKAALEMKERIRKSLKKYPEFKSQLDLINEAYITTFDSFALSILKKYHYILSLSKNIKIADSSLIYLKKQEYINDIFENMYECKNDLFLKLIDDFCIKDDKEIRNSILDIYNSLSIMIDKKNFLNNYIGNFYSDESINKYIKEYEDLIYSKQEKLNIYLEEVSNIDNEYYEKIYNVIIKLIESNNYDEVKNNLDFRLPNLKKESDEELKNIKENISNTIKEIQELTFYDSREEIYNTIISTVDYAKIIIEIIKVLDLKITDYKFKNNIFEFNDISMMLIDILKNNNDIRLEIKDSYKEIMVDEYQDTSDIQEALISLIENNNVYMVGDIKQSIYRFRNANPDIFKEKYQKYSDGNNGYKIDLNRNFRSRKEVLDNINLIFSHLMDLKIGGASYTDGHEMIYGNKSYDDMNVVNYDMDILNYCFDKNIGFTKEEVEIFIIAHDILNKVKNKYQVVDKKTFMLRDCTFNDFAILIDRSTNFDLFRKIFEYKKIPLTIYKDEKLNNGDEIIVIKNLIKLILKIYNNTFDKEFKYLFVSVARSFVFKLNDNDIFKMFTDDNFKDNQIYEKCYLLSKYINTYTSSMLIDKILKEFSIMEKLINLGEVQNRLIRLDYLSDIASNLDNMGYTIEDFSDYLSQLSKNQYDIKFSLSKESPNSVQLMTIHTSKGLEFSVCYFPLLYKEFNLRDLNEKFLFDNKYGIITPYFKEGIGKTIFKYLLKNKYVEEEISEKIRLFYVALTRSKEKIIMIADINDYESSTDKLSFRSFLDMVKYLGNNLDIYKNNVDLEQINLSHNYNLNKKISDLSKFAKNSNKIITHELEFDNKQIETSKYSKINNNYISKEEEKKLKIGTYFHYLLEMIDFKNNDLDKYNIDNFYKDKIIKFLNLDIFNNINDAIIYKEYEFISCSDNIKKHGIIDLMIEYHDYIDIIDYKFRNIDDDNYISQLLGYKEFIMKKTKKNVNIYLYSIMENKLKNVG